MVFTRSVRSKASSTATMRASTSVIWSRARRQSAMAKLARSPAAERSRSTPPGASAAAQMASRMRRLRRRPPQQASSVLTAAAKAS
jgi:hypothetical protein